MENLILTLKSKKVITAYIRDARLYHHEIAILDEILEAITGEDHCKLEWFQQFGPSIRHIHMNVHAYRKGLEFGFIQIKLDQYNWLARTDFLDKDDVILGNANHYAQHSVIRLGRGPSGIWSYGLNYSYGLASGGYALSVFGYKFPNRQDALMAGLNDLKERMVKVVGGNDTTNYKQPIIIATLDAIRKAQISTVQLALF